MLGWQAADRVDWSRLFHAYGPATDTPAHLRALTGDDLDAQLAALDYLDYAVLHQGTVYSVTPVAVRVTAGLLPERALRRARPEGAMLLPEVLAFLGWAADSAAVAPIGPAEPTVDAAEMESFHRRLNDGDDDAWGSPAVGVLMHRAVLDLRQSAAELVEAIVPFVDDGELTVRIDAVGALARVGALPSAAQLAGSLTGRLHARMSAAKARDERATLVLALDRLAASTARWLEDDDPAIRACAALTSRDDPRSTAMLISALTRPREADAWFADGLPLLEGHTRFTLLRELVDRKVPFSDLLPAALAVVEVAHAYTADSDWGPLLQAAFPSVAFTPGVRPPPPATLDHAQRAFLKALTANQSLWDPINGNAKFARMRVGLPDERSTVAKLARHAPEASG